MATNYGMGQYRKHTNTGVGTISYLTPIVENMSPKVIDVKVNTYVYKDIYFDLNELNNNQNHFQYGEVYFLELTLPRHIQYTSDIDVKICGQVGNEIDIENQFQNIRQITVPSTSSNSEYYKDVLLYEYDNTIKVGIITPNSQIISDGNIYYRNSDNIRKYYIKQSQGDIEINNYQTARIVESWKLVNIDDNTITYKMIFSPKFDNKGSGYPYLYLEIDRNNEWNTNTQYIDGQNNNTYRGLFIDTTQAKLNVYTITNLVGNQNAILSSSLNHIGVWGHPEMYLAINGEQIQIGKNGFYELDDFNITNLGVAIKDEDDSRFSIDYEYIIEEN